MKIIKYIKGKSLITESKDLSGNTIFTHLEGKGVDTVYNNITVTTTVGEILHEEFLKPLKLSSQTISKHLDIPMDRIISGKLKINSMIDYKLCTYFKVSEGYFLRIQDACNE